MANWHIATRFSMGGSGMPSDTRIEAERVDYSAGDFVSFYGNGGNLVLVIPTHSLLYAKRLVEN